MTLYLILTQESSSKDYLNLAEILCHYRCKCRFAVKDNNRVEETNEPSKRLCRASWNINVNFENDSDLDHVLSSLLANLSAGRTGEVKYNYFSRE